MDELDYPPEVFAEEPVSPIEVMENHKRELNFYYRYLRFIKKGKTEWAGRLGNYLDREFNLGLANK